MSEFTDRIIGIFNRNILNESRGPIWDWCVNTIKTVELNEANLENMANNYLTFGTFGGKGKEGNRDTLKRLAEALGIVGITNPEGGPHGAKPQIDIDKFSNDELLNIIIENLPMKVELSQFIGGEITSKTDRGTITNRHCHYLWITKKIIDLYPDRKISVIEIGSGLGLLGYFLDRAGYKDYTSIDLAYANVIQSYFLWRNLPERNFILSGEVKNPFNKKHKNSIKLLHASDFIDVPKNRFDIMVNADSMTEMTIAEAKKYIESDCSPLLLSINHEVNGFRVIEITKNKKKLKYRNHFWLRPGYVEELYETI